MGLFTTVKRNFKNAGANVSCVFEFEKENYFYFKKNGLKIHEGYQKVCKYFRYGLGQSRLKEEFIRENCWAGAFDIIINKAKEIPPHTYGGEHVVDSMCFLIELAFDEYNDGDYVVISLEENGDIKINKTDFKEFPEEIVIGNYFIFMQIVE